MSYLCFNLQSIIDILILKISILGGIMQGSLNQYIIRVAVFLVIIFIIAVFLYPVLQSAFLSNIYINLTIILSLFFGLGFCIYNLFQLQSNYENLASFNIYKSPETINK